MPQRLTTLQDGPGYDPTWSADGKSLALGGSPVIRVLNLTTNHVSVLPGSDGLYSPRWSPDGRYIAALSTDSARLLAFDFQSQRWTELGKRNFGYPTWSRDSKYIYFDILGADPAFFRVRVSDRKIEQLVSLKDVPRAVGDMGPWTGVAPDGSPLIQRDASVDEIYALDWEAP